MWPQLTGSAKGTVFPASIDAAPAARPRKPGLGRLRDPARAALRPLCEELAGSGLAQVRPVPESAAPIEPKVAARGAPGGAFLLTKEEGDASQASHRAASPAAHREPYTLLRLPALRSPRGGAGIWNRTRACPGPTKEHGRRSVGLPAAARRPGYLEFKLEMSALNLSRHPEERGGEVAEPRRVSESEVLRGSLRSLLRV